MSEYKCARCGNTPQGGANLWAASRWDNFIASRPLDQLQDELLLCDDCWRQRQQLHMKTDQAFFGHIDPEELCRYLMKICVKEEFSRE